MGPRNNWERIAALVVIAIILGVAWLMSGCANTGQIKKGSPEAILVKAATRNVAKYVSLNNPEIVSEGLEFSCALAEEEDPEAAVALAKIGLKFLSDETAHVSHNDVRDAIQLLVIVIGDRLDVPLDQMSDEEVKSLLEAIRMAAGGACEGFTEAQELIRGD